MLAIKTWEQLVGPFVNLLLLMALDSIEVNSKKLDNFKLIKKLLSVRHVTIPYFL